jgi:hypothetical protein
MRITFQEGSIHEGSRVSFISVTDDVFFVAAGFATVIPFYACGKARSPSAAKA